MGGSLICGVRAFVTPAWAMAVRFPPNSQEQMDLRAMRWGIPASLALEN